MGREGGERDKGKEFSSNLDHNCFSRVSLPGCFNERKSTQKHNLPKFLTLVGDVGGLAQTMRLEWLKRQRASAFHFFPFSPCLYQALPPGQTLQLGASGQ